MKSLWDVTYIGAHTNIFIKKLKRHLSIQVSDLERERFDFDGKKLERVTFLVAHEADDWASLVEEVLTISNRITSEWTLQLDLPGTLAGEIRSDSSNGREISMRIPDGFVALRWEIALNQTYERKRRSNNADSW